MLITLAVRVQAWLKKEENEGEQTHVLAGCGLVTLGSLVGDVFSLNG